jgi:membrane associated rhomboid family serine protease
MIPLRDVIPSRTTPGVTVTLIAVNVAVYLFQLMLTDRSQDAFIIGFGLVPAYFSPINVVTAMFVHGGFVHLAGNMLFL